MGGVWVGVLPTSGSRIMTSRLICPQEAAVPVGKAQFWSWTDVCSGLANRSGRRIVTLCKTSRGETSRG